MIDIDRIDVAIRALGDLESQIRYMQVVPAERLERRLAIEYIREVPSKKDKKVILELNGKLKNLSLQERLKYNLFFKDFGRYTKLNIFKDIENILGD